MHALDGNVRVVWIEYECLNSPYISNILCFLAEAHPIINLDTDKQRYNPAVRHKQQRATPRACRRPLV